MGKDGYVRIKPDCLLRGGAGPSVCAGEAWRRYAVLHAGRRVPGHAVGANGGTDLLGVDPDVCLIFKGGYYDRVKELISRYQV